MHHPKDILYIFHLPGILQCYKASKNSFATDTSGRNIFLNIKSYPVDVLVVYLIFRFIFCYSLLIFIENIQKSTTT